MTELDHHIFAAERLDHSKDVWGVEEPLEAILQSSDENILRKKLGLKRLELYMHLNILIRTIAKILSVSISMNSCIKKSRRKVRSAWALYAIIIIIFLEHILLSFLCLLATLFLTNTMINLNHPLLHPILCAMESRKFDFHTPFLLVPPQLVQLY